MASTPAATMKRPRYEFEDAAEVIVGSDKRSFMIYTNHFSERSPFLKAAFSESWITGRTHIVLSDIHAETFNYYLSIAYGHELELGDDDHWALFVRTYVLADRLGDLKAANSIANKMLIHPHYPSQEIVKEVMRTTASTSPLRRFMLDSYLQEPDVFGCLTTSAVEEDESLRDFLSIVGRMYLRKAGSARRDQRLGEVFGGDIIDNDYCRYHQHNAAVPTTSSCGKSQENDDSDWHACA